MKGFRYISIVGMLMVLLSCYDDLGNYIYDDPEVIAITGIDEEYAAVA